MVEVVRLNSWLNMFNEVEWVFESVGAVFISHSSKNKRTRSISRAALAIVEIVT